MEGLAEPSKYEGTSPWGTLLIEKSLSVDHGQFSREGVLPALGKGFVVNQERACI